MEPLSATFIVFGLAILLVSWVMLLIAASREDFAWGLCALLLPPLAYLYGLFRLDLAKEPVLLAIAGCLLVLLGIS